MYVCMYENIGELVTVVNNAMPGEVSRKAHSAKYWLTHRNLIKSEEEQRKLSEFCAYT